MRVKSRLILLGIKIIIMLSFCETYLYKPAIFIKKCYIVKFSFCGGPQSMCPLGPLLNQALVKINCYCNLWQHQKMVYIKAQKREYRSYF